MRLCRGRVCFSVIAMRQDVRPKTLHPVDGNSPPRAPDGMIASPSASLVHRKYVFQGDVICECGETGCVIATGFQLPKPSPPPKVERVSFSPVTSLGTGSSSGGCSSSSSQLQQVLRFDSQCADSHTVSCAGLQKQEFQEFCFEKAS